MRFADLDAVTVDGFGTLVELESPITPLAHALGQHGVQRTPSEVAEAFAAEASHYRAGAHLARDDATLASFREECVRVFLDALSAELEPSDFVEPFLTSLVFRPVAGAVEALASLRQRELKLAVVSNWDCSLPERLEALGLLERFDAVVTSAEAGAAKPASRPFSIALERLDVAPERALHIGDEPADEQGAASAGMHFAPAPLSTAVAGLA